MHIYFASVLSFLPSICPYHLHIPLYFCIYFFFQMTSFTDPNIPHSHYILHIFLRNLISATFTSSASSTIPNPRQCYNQNTLDTAICAISDRNRLQPFTAFPFFTFLSTSSLHLPALVNLHTKNNQDQRRREHSN